MGSIMVWGASQHGDHGSVGTTVEQGAALWQRLGVPGTAGAGWEEAEGGEQVCAGWGGQIKSQPLPRQPWERLSKASPWPRPPKAPAVPRCSARLGGAVSVNKSLIIQETLEQDDEIFLLLRSPRAWGQTSQA